MELPKRNHGFTLIELLLVIGIVAVILSIIIPMGIRTRIATKYSNVRQGCNELAAFTTDWAERMVQAQDESNSESTLVHYYISLTGENSENLEDQAAQWIATTEANNWNENTGEEDNLNLVQIWGRNEQQGGSESEQEVGSPEAVVEEFIPEHKPIKNPFTQSSIFNSRNYPEDNPVPGTIAFGAYSDGDWVHFGFCFQGTDNEDTDVMGDDTYYAGMGFDSAGAVRNGIFMSRLHATTTSE